MRARPGPGRMPAKASPKAKPKATKASPRKSAEKAASAKKPAPAKKAATKPKARTTKAAKPPAGESASKLIDQWLRELGGWRGETLARMRALILEADPEMIEERKWVKP